MEYTISNVTRRGEWKSKYARTDENDMVDYAISLTGNEDGWIKLTQKISTKPPEVGDTIFGEIITAVDNNNEPYRRFKKINPKFVNDLGNRTSSVDAGGSTVQVNYIIRMLEELTGRRAPDFSENGAENSDNKDNNDPFVDL